MDGMVVIREVSAGDWEAMRDVRLDALRDAPSAFGSTYAREAGFTHQQWQARIHDRSVTYLAHVSGDEPDSAEPAGLAGVYEEDGTAEVVSMWVRPCARGRKVGESLIGACEDWARARGYDTLHLWVTESNLPARKLYERCGFTPTGESQPLPSDPSVPEIRMRKPL